MTEDGAFRGKSLRLRKPYLWTLYIVSIGVWLSGAIWLVLHYFFRVKGQFGFKTNPGEIWFLTTHGGFAFASVFVFGLLWSSHVLAGWNMRWRRRSGGWLAGTTIFLTLTGYALYYIGSKDILEWTAIAHWAVGLAAFALFLMHWLSKSRPHVPDRGVPGI